jgi:site-specific DNA-methyltransferase (adenine-specific)
MINLLHGDCLEQMKTLDDNSVDSIVSDPPYGISFMAKKWDYDVPSVEVWKEAMRVLKPGGHALIACGTRTQHRMVVNIEDAGFEIRDVVSWIYGSGFPKSLNIHKKDERCPDGWGTALKPACEFFTLCRKPLSEKTIAANVLKWGTGGINIDGCRVETEENCSRKKSLVKDTAAGFGKGVAMGGNGHDAGRFPANLIHDGSQEVLELFPETKSGGGLRHNKNNSKNNAFGKFAPNVSSGGGDSGSAARFFYCAKASKKDRNEGCEELEERSGSEKTGREAGSAGLVGDPQNRGQTVNPYANGSSAKNNHPTVKPTALMAYLCRLITPTGGVVLDPYMGSGSTGKAAVQEGFSFVGCELDKDYFDIATARVTNEEDLEVRGEDF